MDLNTTSLNLVMRHGSFGQAAIFAGDVPTLDHFLLSSADFARIKCQRRAPVYLAGVEFGHISNVNIMRASNRLVVFFTQTADIEEWDDLQHLFIIPSINVKEIGCIVCGHFYKVADTPCACIRHANVLRIRDCRITGANLYDVLQTDTEAFDVRPLLLSNFFSDIVSAIHFTEPI